MKLRACVKSQPFVAAVVLLAAGCAACNRAQSGPNASAASHSSPGIEAAASPNPVAPAPTTDEAAIRNAIEKHLRGNAGINMAAINMTVDSVSLHEDQAQADVTFRLNQGGTTMQMTYFLSRHANDWIVLRSQPTGGQFAHPPLDEAHRGTAAAPRPGTLPHINDFFPPDSPNGNPPRSSPPPGSAPAPQKN
jgi:hypothetical protein